MRIRLASDHSVTGVSSGFNTHSLGEIIVGFDGEGGMTSDYARDYEVELSSGEWKNMRDAFRDHDLITDNYNTRFFEPRNDDDRKRGWTD